MATVLLDHQIFYTPLVMAGATRTSHNVSAQNADASAAISGAPLHPPPLEDVYDPRRSGLGDSTDAAVVISDNESNCDDFDNSDDDRSNTTIPSPDELLTTFSNSAAATSAWLTFLSAKVLYANMLEQIKMSTLLPVQLVITTRVSLRSLVEPSQTMNLYQPSSSSLKA